PEPDLVAGADDGRRRDGRAVDEGAVAAPEVAELDAVPGDLQRGVDARERLVLDHERAIRAPPYHDLALAQQGVPVPRAHAVPLALAGSLARGAHDAPSSSVACSFASTGAGLPPSRCAVLPVVDRLTMSRFAPRPGHGKLCPEGRVPPR